jgi:16S rRNA (cytosine967-C5)-methyltransferase
MMTQHQSGSAAGSTAPAPVPGDRGLAARRAALYTLRRVRAQEAFDGALTQATVDVAEADRRLAHEIAAGVLRGREELDGLVRPRVTGEWRRVAEDVRDILRIGAYQLAHLSRIPVHAAVAATVEVAKREHGVRTAGFVNAVLRHLATDLAAGTAATPTPSGDAPASPRALAKRYSHPAWMVIRWVERFGLERTEALLQHNNRKSAIHLQPARWSLDRLRTTLTDNGVSVREIPNLPGLIIEGVRVHELPGYAEGAFVVQDPAQALALAHLDIPTGARVWDACAAPGGKVSQLVERCRVFASDPRRPRLPRLIDTVRRAAPGTPVFCADALHAPIRAGEFDAVVLDVPCSATGTIAKHPDARWRLSKARIERLATLQAALLDATAAAVRAGGVLGYVTCSLEEEEDERQVRRFLERHPEFEPEREHLFLFPPERGTDGAFAARLLRNAA